VNTSIIGSTASNKNSDSSSDISIDAQLLGKRFNREWIFRNLTQNLYGGSTYAVVGPNGSGKSTLLQVLWGQVPPTTGTVGYKKSNMPISLDDIHNHISIAAPYMDLIEELTLSEHLNFHFKLKKLRGGKSIPDLIDIMYLKEATDKRIGNFSSGMKQRLKLALAFHTEADFIFLDEPGTNLDDQAFAWYKNQLLSLPQHCLLVIASNNAQEYPENSKIIDLTVLKGRSGT
jgi:ABC-type multidrug transport system ATPase subunit